MEPEPRAFAFHPGGKEGVEDAVHDVRRNARTIVRNSHGDLIIRLADLDPDVLYA